MKAVTSHTLRIEPAHHVLDGAVLAPGIDALQHHQQRAPPFGVQEILENPETIEVLGKLRFGSRLVGAVRIRGIDIVQFDPGTRTHQ